MSTITINKKTYKIINDTQSDGRCFSASMFYALHDGQVATDDKLNVWIQDYIIDPILDTEHTDCPQFLLWVINWATTHNVNVNTPNYVSTIKTTINLPDNINIFQEKLDKLTRITEILKDLMFHLEIETLRILLTKLETVIANNAEWVTNKKHTQTINELIVAITLYLSDKNNQKTLTKLIGSVYAIFDKLARSTCAKVLKKTEYKNAINQYKLYISLLNRPTENEGSNPTYEWTEPNLGPIQVLVTLRDIKSINIYNSSDKNVVSVLNNNKRLTDYAKDIYLYYIPNTHYKPLVETNNTNDINTTKSSKKTTKSANKNASKTNKNTKTKTKKKPTKTIETIIQNVNKPENANYSLHIYVTTKNPNFYKLTYKPNMSILSSTSRTIYFNPLVKYSEAVINNVPKDTLLRQFMNMFEFNSMINRIQSESKQVTLTEPNEYIIENNIQITLNTLFKPNNLFYIDNKPYTIVSLKLNPSDWNLNKQLTSSPNQYINPRYNPNSYYNPNPYYNPNSYYNPNPYYNLNPYSRNNDNLFFYVTVDLELVSGITANLLQKSVVNCQNRFETIKDAWNEIFISNKKGKTETNKQKLKPKNKTQKLEGHLISK